MNAEILTEALLDDPSFREVVKEFVESQLTKDTLFTQLEFVVGNIMERARESRAQEYVEEEIWEHA